MCGGINEALPFHPEFSWLIAPLGAPPHHFNFKWSLPTPPVRANKCSLAEMRASVGNDCRHLLITAPFVRGGAWSHRRNAALTTRRKSSRSEMRCSHFSPAFEQKDTFVCLNEVRHLLLSGDSLQSATRRASSSTGTRCCNLAEHRLRQRLRRKT